MNNIVMRHFNNLISQGSRIEWLEKWLLSEIWTSERYQDLSPIGYLEKGESEVNELEEVISHAADRMYHELIDDAPKSHNVINILEGDELSALVVFDGLSLREIPFLMSLAQKSHFFIREIGTALSALPSESVSFIEQRLKLNAIAPSQLPINKELKERNISAYYYDNPNRRQTLDNRNKNFLLWSAFPDNTYADSDARFPQHFEQMHSLLETAWINIVQQIPRGRKIVITSDHGYVYFGHGLSFLRSNAEIRCLTEVLAGERFLKLDDECSKPLNHPDLMYVFDRKVAVIKGRVQTHPCGKGSGRLYKHGGLSIMEMLVPWIELGYDK